jgi:hypothetical protein
MKLDGFLSVTGEHREINMGFANSRGLEALPTVPPITGGLLGTWSAGWGVLEEPVRAML